MKTYIALFRGINVGGNNILAMKDLKAILEKLGAENVKTYIQSGNAVFRHDAGSAADLADRISAAVRKNHGFRPQVFLRSAADLAKAIVENPFPHADKEPKTLHVFFLESAPKTPDLKTLECWRTGSERFALKGLLFYLHAPDGIGRSKLANSAGKALGVAATARNWRTVTKLMDMIQE